MPHKPVKFPQLSEEKSHEQSLNLPSLFYCRLIKGIQLKSTKSDSSVLLHAWHRLNWLTDNATDEWR